MNGIVPPIQAQQAQERKPVKILFLLDGSSSMLDDWKPNTARFKAAGDIIVRIVDSIQKVNPSVSFGLRVFGHQYPVNAQNCYDTKLEVPFSARNIEQIKARLRYLSARGVSPIAWSLRQTAENDFVQSDRYAYSIILITDGGESCGGNVCETVRQLLSSRITFKPYILSLVDYDPLKGSYDCFGKFLTVSTPDQVSPAIKTIVEDNKVMFENNDGNMVQTLPDVVADTPVTRGLTGLVDSNTANRARLDKMLLYLKVPTGAQISAIPSKWFHNMEVSSNPIRQPQAKVSTYKTIWPTLNIPLDPDPVSRSIQRPIGLRYNTRVQPVLSHFVRPAVKRSRLIPVWAKVDFIRDLQEELPKVAVIGSGRKTRVQKIMNIIVFPEAKKTAVTTRLPKVRFAPEEVQSVVVAEKPVPPTPTAQPPRKQQAPQVPPAETPVSITREKSEETKVLVYFTNGKGKFYKTEPQIDFYDVKAKKVVQSSYRNVNRATGEPEPIKLAPGTYRVTKQGTYLKSAEVTVEPNATTKIVVTVFSGSIKFQYETNKDRPVKEYTALVSNRFERTPVVKQRCDELLEYEPGRYHIEINTLPVTMSYIPELSFMQTHIVTIKDPGTIQITNTTFKGKVQFYFLRSSGYEPFYDMDLTGRPEQQKADFLPGKYQVYFFKDGEEQMKPFQIKSNQVTTLEL